MVQMLKIVDFLEGFKIPLEVAQEMKQKKRIYCTYKNNYAYCIFYF